MYSLTINCATKAALLALVAALPGETPIADVKVEAPKKDAKPEAPKKADPKPEPKAKPADDGLGLGGAANDSLDDLLSAAEPASPTADDMKDKLREVLGAKGKDIVSKILAKHGAQKVTDITEDFDKVIATCDAVLKAK